MLINSPASFRWPSEQYGGVRHWTAVPTPVDNSRSAPGDCFGSTYMGAVTSAANKAHRSLSRNTTLYLLPLLPTSSLDFAKIALTF
jgi:hypothetical protein